MENKKVYCIDCRYDGWRICYHPDCVSVIDTPYQRKILRRDQTVQNATNNCPLFEKREEYNPTGIKGWLWKLRSYLTGGI
jgi:hypothetical protein